MASSYELPNAIRKIAPNDVILLFVSSHGRNIRGQFKLVPSNWSPEAESSTTVDYKNDVLAYLDRIPCKKLILLDACHSGSAKGSKDPTDKSLGEALNRLNQEVNGASIISSCQPNELSYEDVSWGNGAFTEALLEALSDKPASDSQGTFSADVNKNGLLSINELYTFLNRRVPVMVASTKEGSMQRPFLQNKGLEADLEIFVVKK